MFVDDELGEGQSAEWRQVGVSVCHEGLGYRWCVVVTTPIPEALAYLPRRSQPPWELHLAQPFDPDECHESR